MPIKGKITTWNDDKGFGFVEPCSGGKQAFLHIKALSHRGQRPRIGQLVTYSLGTNTQGRPRAIKAVLAGTVPPAKRQPQRGSLSMVLAVLFLAGVGLAALTAQVPPLLLAGYLLASLVTFGVYALDKSAAKKGTWRTQESTLHLLALAGGWPGALIAQQKLRHKSKKASFRAAFWLTVALNGGAFAWLVTSNGSATLQGLLTNLT